MLLELWMLTHEARDFFGKKPDRVQASAGALRQNADTMRQGDVFCLNAPYNGGTHLPDITVVTPVFDDAGERVLFYVASRGHHADVGGIAPGSMSPKATRIEEEGVYLDNVRLVEGGAWTSGAGAPQSAIAAPVTRRSHGGGRDG